MTYHFYDGPNYVETVISKELVYSEIINMQSNEMFSIKLNRNTHSILNKFSNNNLFNLTSLKMSYDNSFLKFFGSSDFVFG